MHWGICTPASCTSEDIVKLMVATTGHQKVVVNDNYCHTNEPHKFTTLDIFYGYVNFSYFNTITFYYILTYIASKQLYTYILPQYIVYLLLVYLYNTKLKLELK